MKTHIRRIIGLDPGLSATGYGVLEVNLRGDMAMIEGGVIRTKPRDSIEHRLLVIHRELTDVITEFEPREMAIEDLHSRYRNLKTAIIMGHARGVAVLAAGQAGISVHHYQPTRVKSVVAGSGRAGKSEMLTAVGMRLNLRQDLKQRDVADALGIAICHAHISQSPVMASREQTAPQTSF